MVQMYISSLLEPQVGDMLQRYRMNDDRLIGVFCVTEIDRPSDKNGNRRRDVIRVTCLFNDDLGSRYSMYKSVQPGDSTWVHKVHLLNHWNAKHSGTSAYYKIKKDK